MPITTRHPQYRDRESDWLKCRDVIAGAKAVKMRRRAYLPQHQLEQREYDDYLDRALYYGATARTVQAMVGAVFRRPPIVTPESWPSPEDDHLRDIGLDDVPLEVFARQVLEEVISVGRYAVLVDYPAAPVVEAGGTQVTLPPEEDRPYWVGYPAESLTNWRIERVRGNTVLVMAVLRESYWSQDPRDPYVMVPMDRYRELALEDGVYVQRLWERGAKDWTVVSSVMPRRQGTPLDFIPLTIFGPQSLGPDATKPPLLDLADVNISHYRTSADLEHARHWTALPMLYVFSSALPEAPEIRFGSSEALLLSDSGAKAGFIEYTGQGIGALERALEEKERMMAAIGARLLEAPRPGVEKPEAMKIRLSGEQSFLQSVAGTVGEGLSRCLRHHLWWAGASDGEVAQASVELNTDFLAQRISPQEIRELVLAQQAGLISRQTFVYQLKEGEVLPPGRSVDEELELIRSDGFAGVNLEM